MSCGSVQTVSVHFDLGGDPGFRWHEGLAVEQPLLSLLSFLTRETPFQRRARPREPRNAFIFLAPTPTPFFGLGQNVIGRVL